MSDLPPVLDDYASLAAQRVSEYLTTGMHYSTDEAQEKIAEIIVEARREGSRVKMGRFVYELVDVTDPESYYSIGVYEWPEDAKGVLLLIKSPICEHDDGLHVYEVRRRKLNKLDWPGDFKVVGRYNLIEVSEDEEGEDYWSLEECDV